jgi:hypothetical protein
MEMVRGLQLLGTYTLDNEHTATMTRFSAMAGQELRNESFKMSPW